MFIQTKRMNLRPVEMTDSEMLRDSSNCQSSREFLNRVIPQTITSEDAWLKNVISSETNMLFVAETKDEKPEVVGIFGIHAIKWIDRTCMTGANIWKDKFQSNGYGYEAKMHVLHHIFVHLNLRKVCSAALATNPRSIAYQKKTGAIVEGVLKQEIHQNGQYVDKILLSIFKEEFMKKWKKFNKDD